MKSPLSKYFDREQLQQIQNDFMSFTGMSFAVVDEYGNLITKPSSPYCTSIRSLSSFKECVNCIWCFEDVNNSVVSYQRNIDCPFGFEDFFIPLQMEEKEIGRVIIGQIYKSKPLNTIDNLELSEVREMIPVVPENKQESFKKVAQSITKLITQISFSRAWEKNNRAFELIRDIVLKSLHLEVRKMVEVIHNEIKNFIFFDSCTTCFYDPINKRLDSAYSEGIGEDILKKAFFYEGEGYAGWVTQNKIPLIIDDADKASNIHLKYTTLRDLGLKSFLIVPLLFNDEIIGVIILASKEKNSFNQELANLMYLLANQLSAVISKERLNVELKRKIAEMEKIIEISTISGTDKLLDFVVDKIRPLFNAVACSIYLKDKTIGFFSLEASKGILEGEIRKPDSACEVGEGLIGYIAATGESLILDDVNDKTKLNELGLTTSEKSTELSDTILPGLYIPLIDRTSSTVFGVIRLLGRETGGLFNESDRDLVKAFTDRIELYITRADAHEKNLKLNKELERLNNIQVQLHRGLDEDKELFLILTALTIQGGLSFNRAILFLIHEESNEDKNTRKFIEGRMAIGPADESDADRIYKEDLWQKGKSFAELLEIVEKRFDDNRSKILFSKLNVFIRETRFALDDQNIITDVIFNYKNSKKFNLRDDDFSGDSFYLKLQSRNMGATEFVIAPLFSQGREIGLIYVDNKFDNVKITEEDKYLLNIYVNQAGAVIHKSQAVKLRQNEILMETYHTLSTKFTQIDDVRDKLKRHINLSTHPDSSLKAIYNELEHRCKVASDAILKARDFPNSIVINKYKGQVELLLSREELFFGLNVNSDKISLRTVSANEVIFCDFDCLRNILREMIENSQKHSGRNNDLTISITCLIKEYGEIRALEIQYIDNGKGIPLENKDKIFAPFFTNGPKDTCSGIGMALVKRNIESHGGWIREDGIPGEGARFIMELPVQCSE